MQDLARRLNKMVSITFNLIQENKKNDFEHKNNKIVQ